MADFDELRRQLRETRAAIEDADGRAAALRDRLRRLAAREAALARVLDPRSPQGAEEGERLRREQAEAEAALERVRAARARTRTEETALTAQFARFTDPREGIARLDDATPILLMPVRLETRFKDLADPTGAPARRELWVRIYPDDCSIDSFDPTLTDGEVTSARRYWVGIWQAGGIEEEERGAWRGLVGSHGSARASWIVRQYVPANLAERPTKARATDVILVVPADASIMAAERTALAAYWRSVWLAGGDARLAAAARAALDQAVGAPRAGQLVEAFVPQNLASPLPPGVDGDPVAVSVAFVVLPEAPDSKQGAWARAPRLALLPDRFVFLGYRGAEPPLVFVGNPVPPVLAAGPDPGAPAAEQVRHDDEGRLIVPDELRWLSDFERAVGEGMGLRIPLTEAQRRGGFDRVVVVGVRLRSDAATAKRELETLLTHHAFGRRGLSLVPQGTPTNNTERGPSGHTRAPDAGESFDDLKAPLFTHAADPFDRQDGEWLAEYLGIDPGVLAHVHGAGGTDQRAGRAMNAALWPGTLGYWMETMMAPVFPRGAIVRTREFFTRHVLGAGAVPAIRIGAQPYGILPATRLSAMRWLDDAAEEGADAQLVFARRLRDVLAAIDEDWRALVPDLSFVGKPGDPHAILLDVLGLHPGSVEWTQRYAETLQTIFNRLRLQGFGGVVEALVLALARKQSRDLLTRLGHAGAPDPQILDKVFSSAGNRLKGGVADGLPPSESAPLRAVTTDGRNYLKWLIDAGSTSLVALYQQAGFTSDEAPSALLYLLARHALQLGYHDVSVDLHEAAGLLTREAAARARGDDPFLHVRDDTAASESRYRLLYAVQPVITGSATMTVGDFIGARLGTLTSASGLRDQIAALERLKAEPTARLERTFADHVDCCAYRLDAWLLGLVHLQLARMRERRDGQDTTFRGGIHLGGYAWLEDLRPDDRVLTPVPVDPQDLPPDAGGGAGPPMRDSANQGYIHTPSLNQAVTAAILRNGFISDASPESRQTLAVNLTSARTRRALALIEGIRSGQSLGDLLGYQFERGLHDRHGLAEVDKFIFKLRKFFPLRGDRLASTRTDPSVPIEAIEARNVVDGLALVEHVRRTGNRRYKLGIDALPDATAAEAAAIDAEIERLLDAHDAVADLALAEGVYQSVLGNYDRLASTYDAYARGNFPPEPQVVSTPQTGAGLSHRVALHLEAGADPTASPIPSIPMTPRAQAEPAVNRWLHAVLPPPDRVGCTVAFRRAATGELVTREITLDRLALQPADLIGVLREDAAQATAELDDRLLRAAIAQFDPRPDVPIEIRYAERRSAPVSVFELLPLARALRQLVATSRPLAATDLTLQNEATSDQDAQASVDPRRLLLVRAGLQALRDDLADFGTKLEGVLSDLTSRRDELLSAVDDHVDELAGLLARAASFGLPQAGWGFAYDFRRRVFAAILHQGASLAARWAERLAQFDARIAEHDALPLDATEEERVALLARAERAISTVPTAPPPPAQPYRQTLMTVKRPAFAARRDAFAALADTTTRRLARLRADVLALLPIAQLDDFDFTLAPQEEEMVRFAQDASRVAGVMVAAVERRLAAAQLRFDEHDAAAGAPDRVAALQAAGKALLGDDFVIVPEFPLSAAQGDEVALALQASRSGTLFSFLTHPADPATPPLDFPIDTWLHGVARVRGKMRTWEQATIFAGGLGGAEPALDMLQLPFSAGDTALALDLHPEARRDTDRLVYTAHFAGAFEKRARQCGLLLDEWSELIPGATADTGLTFQYDRPDCEAPQAMLLVTPSRFRGAWEWTDLVEAINETLELAKRRAIEPAQIDRLPYAPFLPATIVATQARQLTIAADLASNNDVTLSRG